jgi:uncharacterized protein (DUF1697 family)
MARYVALLRGINVGGRNLIRMADLATCFEGLGFDGVATYIQSGNVVFGATGRASDLTDRIERALGERFGYDASVVVRSRAQMRRIVDDAPPGFGADAARYRDDVLFLKAPLTAKAAIADVPTREGVDRVWAGTGVLYFSRLAGRASGSRLSQIVALPMYKQLTIRNWNTTTKLLERL